MSSIIKVNTYQDANGNALFSSDGSGNVTTSATGLQNTPAFEAYLSSNTTISRAVETKVPFDTKVFDTDNCYDNTTNYRFTPTVAGKYFFYGIICFEDANDSLSYTQSIFKKNGSDYREVQTDPRTSFTRGIAMANYAIVDMNGSSDYMELWGLATTIVNDPNIVTAVKRTFFGAYRIIGA